MATILMMTPLARPLSMLMLSLCLAVPALAINDTEGTANDKPLSVQDPETSLLSTIRYPQEMKATVFAKQPDVQDPTAIAFDEQNRLYITETHRFGRGVEDNRRNQHWLRDDIGLKSTAERLAMYRKYASFKPMEHYTQYSEVIRVLEDRDGDGRSDHAQIYADGFNDPLDGTAAGIIAANGKVYFACIPHIWELRDTDGDGKADVRKSLQDGFGISVSLSGHDLNGFAWGPDGRLYFTIGDRGYNLKTADGRHLNDQYAGAIFRMEPDGSGLEVVHGGLRNPKEIAFDQYGAAFSVDNNADMGDKARVVYMVEGADSGWNRGHQNFNNFRNAIDVSRRHWQPWMGEHIWEMDGENRPAAYLVPAGFVSTGPSGLAYNPGTGLDPKWDNHFFVCDFVGGRSSVIAFEMTPGGASYTVAKQEPFIEGFLNTDVEFGYDGKVYVSDYTGSWTTHGMGAIFSFHNPEEIKKPECLQVRELFAKGFSHRAPEELAKLLSHPDMRVRLRAQFELAKDTQNQALLNEATAANQPLVARLHGLWGMGQLARKHKDVHSLHAIAKLTRDPESKVRGQAVQILGEVAAASQRAIIAKLLDDPDLNVRMLAAIALGKAGNPADIPALIGLLKENDDADAYLRHGAIQGLHNIIQKTGQSAPLMKHANHSSPAVRRGLVIILRKLKDANIARFLADKDPSIVIETIQAINDAYIEHARPALANATDWLGKSTTMIDNRIINAIFRIGGDANLAKLLSLAANPKLPDNVREECLFALRRWENPPPVDPTSGKHRPVNPETKRSLANMRHKVTDTLHELLAMTQGSLLAEVIETTDTLGIKVDEKTMIGHFENSKNPTSIRLAALHVLMPAKSAALVQSLHETLEDRDRQIRAASFASLSTLEPDYALKQALVILASDRDYDRQELFSVLAGMPQPGAASIILESLANLHQLAPAVQLDVLEAAEQRSEPEIAQSLKTYQANLDPKDPLAAYRVSLEGGDISAGRRVFYNHGAAECARCHKGLKNRNGGTAGPDLGNVGSLHNREYLLESIINPNAKTAPGYGIISLTLRDGTLVAGKLMEEDDQTVSVADMAGEKTQTYPRSNIQSITQPMSSMPPMGYILKKREVRDVIAFLESLKQSKEK